VEEGIQHPCPVLRLNRFLSQTPSSVPVCLLFTDRRTELITVIGKAGAKINEIRQASQCQVRVTDPGTPAIAGSEPNPEERLVTITGLPHNINTAVQMLYARLEQEKQKSMA
jgi:polyribonucleotide nucleotidyltransferase